MAEHIDAAYKRIEEAITSGKRITLCAIDQNGNAVSWSLFTGNIEDVKTWHPSRFRIGNEEVWPGMEGTRLTSEADVGSIMAGERQPDSRGEEKYYCEEHRYNPPEGSGLAFCPRCEFPDTTETKCKNCVSFPGGEACKSCKAKYSNYKPISTLAGKELKQ